MRSSGSHGNFCEDRHGEENRARRPGLGYHRQRTEKQRLIFAEHAKLLPELTLNDFAITQGSVLHLVRSDDSSAEMYRLLLRQAHQACKRQRLLLELQRLEEEGSDDD